MASNMPERCQPRFGGIATPQARSNFARSSSFSTCWKPGSRSGRAPMSPPPWTLFCPPQRADAGAVAPDVAGEQAEVDERAHVVHCVVVLGDAEGPADHRPVGAGKGVGELADLRRRHAGDLLGPLQGPGLDAAAERLEAAGRVLDEAAVLEARGEDLPGHGVGQREVGADLERQVPGRHGPLGGRRPARIHGVELRPVVDPLQNVMEEDRMRIPGVAPPEDDEIRLLRLPGRRWYPPPMPKTVARPTTLGACQVRLQESMLLLPTAVRANFCAR